MSQSEWPHSYQVAHSEQVRKHSVCCERLEAGLRYKVQTNWILICKTVHTTTPHCICCGKAKLINSRTALSTVSLMTMVSHMKINVKINELARCVWFGKKVHLLLSSLRSLDLHSSQASSTTLWKIVLLFKSVSAIPLQMPVTHQYLNPPFSSALYFFINFMPHGIVIGFYSTRVSHAFLWYCESHSLHLWGWWKLKHLYLLILLSSLM